MITSTSKWQNCHNFPFQIVSSVTARTSTLFLCVCVLTSSMIHQHVTSSMITSISMWQVCYDFPFLTPSSGTAKTSPSKHTHSCIYLFYRDTISSMIHNDDVTKLWQFPLSISTSTKWLKLSGKNIPLHIFHDKSSHNSSNSSTMTDVATHVAAVSQLPLVAPTSRKWLYVIFPLLKRSMILELSKHKNPPFVGFESGTFTQNRGIESAIPLITLSRLTV